MSIVVTGGAGFIGSCIVRTLNDMGCTDIIIVDNISSTEKWKNLRNKKFNCYIHKLKFLKELPQLKDVEIIIHMGACSSTTECNFDYLWTNNVEYTKLLWKYACEHNIQFIYASSAATYGDGTKGFSDKIAIHELSPLNGYGYSKQVFDIWSQRQNNYPRQYVGLKFFNVYGPNEYCKGSMASMVFHGFNQIKKNGSIKLFRSYREDISNGMQLRDFVYVKDVCDVVVWLLENPQVNGIYNVGTGCTATFKDLAEVIFHSLGLESNIEYIDMPENLIGKYQYYTKADIRKLRDAGYDRPFYKVKDDKLSGVVDYVQNYLDKGYEVY